MFKKIAIMTCALLIPLASFAAYAHFLKFSTSQWKWAEVPPPPNVAQLQAGVPTYLCFAGREENGCFQSRCGSKIKNSKKREDTFDDL